MADDPKKPLGRILLKQQAITQPVLDRALADPRRSLSPLATRLTESGQLSEIAALKALSEQSGVPGIDLRQVLIRLRDLDMLPREVAVRHRLLPVLVRDDRIFVAMVTPTDKKVIDEIEFVTGKRAYPYIALAGPLIRVLNEAYDLRDRGEEFYVGPACPPAIQARAGLAPRAPVTPESAEGAMRPAQVAEPSASSTPVIVDDDMKRLSIADELTESGFGDPEPAPVEEKKEEPPDGRRTLLVVDDEAEIRKLLRRVFEERGYRVVEADRGGAALRLVRERPPDVMILDAMLPEVHGFDIAKQIKGTERYGKIPIIMISAVYRGWRIAEDARSSYGVDAYIEKPFRVPDVVAAVEAAVAQRGSRDPEALSADAEKHLALGIAAYRNGDLAGAIAHLERGTKVDPLAYRLHYHLGLLYGKSGRIYDAIQSLETALHVNGRHFPALRNLAVLYQQAGFKNKAMEAWERALAAAPDDETRQSIREHLLGML